MPDTVRPDATEELAAALRERILVIDGAMGTMIQQYKLDEAQYRGERMADHPADLRRRQRPAVADPARPDPRDPHGLPRRRRRHHLHQHLQRHPHLAGRLRPRGRLLRAEPRRRGPRPRVRRPGRDARSAALRRRVAGPHHPHRLDLARRQRPGRAQRVVRPARRGLPRGSLRPGRRWRRHPAHRDHLRHPQRQGRDLRRRDAVRGARPSLARHRLRHHHRRQRADPVGSGHRGVLELHPPRPPARGRAQLRARRRGDPALRRRALPHRRLLRLLPPQRRSAQRVRRVRRDPGAHGLGRRRVRHRRPGQHRRRLLRHDRRAHRGHRRRGRRRDPSRARRARARHAPLWPRAAHHHRRQPLRQRRRAHQHHRLRAVPQAHQGGRLRHRPLGRRPAGRERRPGHRRQHGRGHDRRRRRHGPVPQAGRGRARHQPGPRDGRLLQVGGHRGRPQVRAGQGHRQLDLHEGGRGEVPRAGAAGAQVRRRRGRDGLRRGRPGRQPRAAQGDLRAGLPAARRRGRLPARGHHLRPQRLRRGDRHRGARDLRPGLHRGHPLDQAEPPRRPGLGRHLQRLLLLPRQQPRARGDPRGLPLPRDRGRPRHGHRQRRCSRGLRPGRARAPRADRGRHPQPPARRGRAPARDRREPQPRR